MMPKERGLSMDIGVAIIVAALLISWRLDDIAEALRKNDDDDETS